jgi:hypothetical protein
MRINIALLLHTSVIDMYVLTAVQERDSNRQPRKSSRYVSVPVIAMAMNMVIKINWRDSGIVETHIPPASSSQSLVCSENLTRPRSFVIQKSAGSLKIINIWI